MSFLEKMGMGPKTKAVTTAMLFATFGTELFAAEKPAAPIKSESTVTDYTPVDAAMENIKGRVANTEDHGKIVYLEKQDSVTADDGRTYQVKVTEQNGQPFQYRFIEIDKNGQRIETVDGGFSKVVSQDTSHIVVADSALVGTPWEQRDVVTGTPDHREFTQPDGKPDLMIVTKKSGAQVLLFKNDVGNWQAELKGSDGKNTEKVATEAIKVLVNKALSQHATIPLKFEKKGGKMAYVAPEGSPRAEN